MSGLAAEPGLAPPGQFQDVAAKTLKEHLVNRFTCFQHPISNALTEGFKSKIQAIKADARGFRRFENYRARILLFCGKPDLTPHLPSALTHSVS